MEIGIIGCSHSFGRGMHSPVTLYGVSDNDPEALALVKEGYPAILSSMYPQHNFEIIPILDGGNREIVNSLIDSITKKPKDLYIVQTTQWHRATLGGLFYKKNVYNVSHNLNYNIYDPRSYHMKRYQDVHHCHFPNYHISKKPHQAFQIKVRGTYEPKYVWIPMGGEEEPFIPINFKQALPFWEATGMVLRHDHLGSLHHLHDLYSSYSMLHYLSQKENVWYFFWNDPFGNVLDLADYGIVEKNQFRDQQGLLTSKLMRLEHKNLIIPNTIHKHFDLDNNGLEENSESMSLPNSVHHEIVELLLSNNELKAELNK